MIYAQNLTFAYPTLQPGTVTQPVFSQLSFDLEEGGVLAVMGVNGSGKSTLGFIIAGLAPRYTGGSLTGDLRVAGEDPNSRLPSTGSVGLLFQDPAPQLFNTTVAYEVAWGLEAMGLPPDEISTRVHEALEKFGMMDHYQHPPWALSGGEQKRCALAALWAMQPRLLVLDEPLNGLDMTGRRNLISAIESVRQSGSTILMMTHQPQAIQIADNVIVLEQGTASTKLSSKIILEHKEQLINTGLAYPPELWPNLQCQKAINDSHVAIEIHNLTYRYTDGRTALRDINLTIPQGQFIAIVGPNGAGKSTLARHLNGLLHPTSGGVRVMGNQTTRFSTGELARYVGFLFQRPEQQLFASTVRDEIAYGPRNLRLDDAEHIVTHALERFNLNEVANLPPAILSYGTQRSITLASLAAMRSPIMVLDEPTVGLDGKGWHQLLSWMAELRASGSTIIVITHEMSLAARADRVLVLDKGMVTADGLPRSVLPQVVQGGVDERYF